MRLEKTRVIEKLFTAASLSVMFFALTAQFSYQSKEKIKERVRRRYGRLCSERSGIYGVPLEASHRNHQRCNGYDDPKNGELLTIYEHLLVHEGWSTQNTLGLSKRDNDFAIRSIKERITIWESCNGDLQLYKQKLNEKRQATR